ncbi:MAG: hypothetical protein KKG47_04605 [Proteobacteria bacterium]|nr:hypothetical protein [Pseudomonadota bacterium]MBU1738800.1 hypothetical protein [Pseudomonadota bacterium]
MKTKKSFWIRIAADEGGSIIVVALLMVMLLAIVIIGGNRSSTTEIKISKNKQTNDRNLYISEALISQAAVDLENVRDNAAELLKNPLLAAFNGVTAPDRLMRKAVLPARPPGTNPSEWAEGETDGSEFHGWLNADWGFPFLPGGPVPAQILWPNSLAWENGNPNQATDVFDYMMVNNGSPGGSLDMSASRVYEYNLRGRVTNINGETEVSIGYRTRY